jgi:Fe-S cluster assembly protein SufB
MPAVQETIDRGPKDRRRPVQIRFRDRSSKMDKAPKGLSEDIIRFISAKKQEPEWMLEWRLEAYRRWLTLEEPTWARVDYPKIDFNDIYYYAAPKSTPGPKSLDDVDPELLKVYEKLGIPLREQEILAGVETPRIAVDAVFDRSPSSPPSRRAEEGRRDLHVDLRSDPRASRSDEEISRLGRSDLRQLLCDAEFGRLHRRFLRLRAEGRALPDGAVDLLPHQREEHRPVRAHADHRRGRRLRLLPRRLHGAAARREPAACRRRRTRRARRCRDQVFDGAELVSGRCAGQGRHLQLRHQARRLPWRRSKISWTQVETGSAITWKYPSCILRGDDSRAASSIRSPCPTAISRSTAAPR